MSDDRELLNAKLCELLHQAFARIRFCTYDSLPDEKDPRNEIHDLAELLHNIPRFIAGTDELAVDSPLQFREAVIEHVRTYFPDIEPTQHRYVQILDMNEWDFYAKHPTQMKHWPDAVPV